MNVATTVEKKNLYSLNALLLHFLPKGGFGRTLLWLVLPFLLLLIDVGISFSHSCSLTKYFPFIALGIASSIFCFKIRGLIGSYLFLALFLLVFFPHLSGEDYFWQIGIVLSIALSAFIQLFAFDEARSCFEDMESEVSRYFALSRQSESDLLQMTKRAEEREKELEDEIRRLKEEAEQRRIEKIQDLERFECIESEINMLTACKNEFIAETREARSAAASYMQRYEDQKVFFQEELRLAQERPAELQKELTKVEETCAQMRVGLLQTHEKSKSLEAEKRVFEERGIIHQGELLHAQQHSTELQNALTQAEGVYAQLEQQYLAKSDILSKMSEELFQALETLKEVEAEKRLFEEKEIVLQKESASELELRKELAHAKGLYAQLCVQFQEKSHILDQTRKELFHAQTKLMTLDLEEKYSQIDPERSALSVLETECAQLCIELEQLEEEVTLLEELYSSEQNIVD